MNTMSPDLVNGFFELVGAVCVWTGVYKYTKDREVKGMYWPTTIFFTSWGGWNLFYYTSLDQSFSFYAGCLLFSGNATWLSLVINDIWRKKYVG